MFSCDIVLPLMEDLHSPTELLAPAGHWECARAAVANGADAIYFGMPQFNARIRADNFTPSDLPELMEFLHSRGVRGFVAFNTLIFTSELEAAADQLHQLSKAGVDAIIVQDLGLATMARAMVPDLDVHASTQMTITSPEALGFADELVDLLKNKPAKVNLIPFNPFPGTIFKRSSADTIQHFQSRLRQRGLVATTRKTRGDDIDAACGQLAGKVSDRVRNRLGDKKIVDRNIKVVSA